LERLTEIPNPYTVDMKNPLHTAENFAAAVFPEDSLTHWQEDFYEWTGPGYVRVADEIMTKHVYDWMEGATASPTDRKVNMILAALRALVQIRYTGTPMAPIFIRNVDQYPPIENLIPVRNGLLDIGGRQLLVHTPDLFNLSSADVSFDANATSPAWEQFLESIYPDDESAAVTLAEYVGYCLTTDTKYQKALALIGAPRSGKGTIQRVVQALLGPDSYCSPTMQSLGTDFGLQTFIGKRAAFIADARTSRQFNSQVAVERLLTIIGEDTQYVNRKHKSQWEGQLRTRIWLASNQLPATQDTGGALVTRFLMLKHAVSFLGREDTGLEDRLKAELPGILNWSLAGLSRLHARGRFIQPDAGREMISQWEALNSPMKAFVDECCVLAPNLMVKKDDLRIAFRDWCARVGSDKATITDMHFTNELNSATNHAITTRQIRVGDNRTRFFSGIGLVGTAGTSGTSKY
jgi:putative DNA primase/helicase